MIFFPCMKNGRQLPWIVGEWTKKLLSVSHRSYYLPLPSASENNWSAHHRQITIFCSTSLMLFFSSSESHCEKSALPKNSRTLGFEQTYLKTKHKSPIFVKTLEIYIKKRKIRKRYNNKVWDLITMHLKFNCFLSTATEMHCTF